MFILGIMEVWVLGKLQCTLLQGLVLRWLAGSRSLRGVKDDRQLANMVVSNEADDDFSDR